MIDAPCLVCGARESRPVWHVRHDPYLEVLGLPVDGARKVMCRRCGLLYSRPQLEASEISRLYASFRESDAPNAQHLAAKQRLAGEDFRWLGPHLSAQGAVLDVGCSEGSFLQLLQGAGWTCTGIEPSSYAVFARDHYGLDVHRGVFEDITLARASFDLVTALRVLEHVADPRDVLRRVADVLRPGGLLYLEVPYAWKPRHRLGEFLGAQHLRLFTPASLSRLLRDAGFTPLALDSGGRGLRVVARLDVSIRAVAPAAHEETIAPTALEPLQLRLIYLRHQARYFWKVKGRVALVAAARKGLGGSRLRTIRGLFKS